MGIKKRILGVLLFSMYVFSILGCSFKEHVTRIRNDVSLYASFLPYHSAMGQGQGIIFRVTIPDDFSKKNVIDSFYVNGIAIPFKILKSEKRVCLEANYFVDRKLPSYSNEPDKKISTDNNEMTDPVILAHKFYPSWIIASNKTVKERFNIPFYQEIIAEAKY